MRYRIACVAVCLEHGRRGRALRDALAQLVAIDEDRIRFGSATWFWERWPNSYVLQVAPEGQMLSDEATVEAAGCADDGNRPRRSSIMNRTVLGLAVAILLTAAPAIGMPSTHSSNMTVPGWRSASPASSAMG